MVTWMVLTLVISLKYILVVLTHDWTSLEVTFSLNNQISENFMFFSGLDFHLIPLLHHPCLLCYLVFSDGNQSINKPGIYIRLPPFVIESYSVKTKEQYFLPRLTQKRRSKRPLEGH